MNNIIEIVTMQYVSVLLVFGPLIYMILVPKERMFLSFKAFLMALGIVIAGINAFAPHVAL